MDRSSDIKRMCMICRCSQDSWCHFFPLSASPWSHAFHHGPPASSFGFSVVPVHMHFFCCTLRLHRMSRGVKTTCFKAPGVSLGGSGVSIGGVRRLRIYLSIYLSILLVPLQPCQQIYFVDISGHLVDLLHHGRCDLQRSLRFAAQLILSFWKSRWRKEPHHQSHIEFILRCTSLE